MWIVEVTKKPQSHPWKEDFFPRKIRYKMDALELQRRVETYGGEAKIKKVQ